MLYNAHNSLWVLTLSNSHQYLQFWELQCIETSYYPLSHLNWMHALHHIVSVVGEPFLHQVVTETHQTATTKLQKKMY